MKKHYESVFIEYVEFARVDMLQVSDSGADFDAGELWNGGDL